jgi:3-oxoacyl-[acyl-carrier protein] reductase
VTVRGEAEAAPAIEPRLSGRVAIVTGAGRNIGAAIARALATDGAAVCVNYPADEEQAEAEAVATGILTNGGRAIVARADVADEDAVEQMVDECRQRLGPPTVLVNNAAVSHLRSWHMQEVAEWRHLFDVNVLGGFICARAVRSDMLSRGDGAIVNVSSVMAFNGKAGKLGYVTTKAAIVGFTRALAREAGPDGIRVNAVVPGAIETPAEAEWGTPDEVDAEVFGVQALTRRGLPADVASVVAFLASEEAGFVTGQSIVVDGGWVMR